MKRIAICISLILLAQVASGFDSKAIEYNSIGKELYESQEYDKAIEYFLAAIKLEPDYAEAHSNLGLVYYHLEMYEESLSEFKIAVSIEPTIPEYRIYLAAAYERNGMVEEAIDELEMYLKLTASRDNEEADEEVREMIDKLRGYEVASTSERYQEVSGVEQPIFSFIVISDVHMGENFDGGKQDSDYLYWVLNDAYNAIKPAFIVVTGDITDSTNGGLMAIGGPYQKEWDEYRSIVDASSVSYNDYYDIPGNHDHYSDRNFSYYLRNSIQGSVTGSTQHSWFLEAEGKKYQFIGVCTAGNDGRPWPIDNAGLDQNELGWINSAMDESADMIFFFGHHPLEDLEYGGEAFKSILLQHPSVYIYGHTHDYGISYYEECMLVNVDSLGKSSENHYLYGEVGANNEISVASYNAYELPE
ncbi:MAG: tetratricopeptide repeat protein [Candidatus Thermoplasmatota archaeon]|nr:tetratricopeptide repeat protein [Candidatus Thermoplasmatota archaeon]